MMLLFSYPLTQKQATIDFCNAYSLPYIQIHRMEQIRNHSKAHTPDLFQEGFEEEPPLKIGTEVFDCTMPSELEFDDETSGKPSSKGELSIFENRREEEKSEDSSQDEKSNSKQPVFPCHTQLSQYEMLTRSIVTFTFHKNPSVILGQPEYAVGSYIPHFLNFKTFTAKFRDELSELSKGESALKLFWKSVVGYVKVEVLVRASAIYLLERRKEGLMVRASWSLGDLFKLFSDKEERKARIIFRTGEGEVRLITRQLQQVDLNLLASLLAEASLAFQISSST